MSSVSSQYFTRQEIVDRGWYRDTLARLLPEPNKVENHNGQRLELFWKWTIVRIEGGSDFALIQQETAHRIHQQRQEAIRAAKLEPIAIPPIARPALREQARQHDCKQKRRTPHRGPVMAPILASTGHWNQIEVDYLIFLANWTVKVDHFKKNPFRQAQVIRTERILISIAQAYPHLIPECRLRLSRILEGNPKKDQIVAMVERNTHVKSDDHAPDQF